MPEIDERADRPLGPAAPDVRVDSPGAGQVAAVAIGPGQTVFLEFAAPDAEARIVGDTLQFLLADRAIVTLEGFPSAVGSGNPPVLVMADGARLAGDLLLEALESLLREGALETAAGPVHGAAGAAGAYEEDLGEAAFADPQDAALGLSGLGLDRAGALDGVDAEAIANVAAEDRRFGSAGATDRPDGGAPAPAARLAGAAVLPGSPGPDSPGPANEASGGDPAPTPPGPGPGDPVDQSDAADGGSGAAEPEDPPAEVNVRGGNGDDALDGGASDDRLDGRGGDDTLRGLDGDDRLIGGAGDDDLDGGSGDDDLRGGKGDDLLSGGADDDALRGGKGDDALTGEAGDDVLRGEAGDDILRGGPGNDALDGGSGDDILIGGAGADRLKGGGGADAFVLQFDPDGAIDVIVDFKPRQGDVLNVYDLLADGSGGVPGLDADSIDNYVRFATEGRDTLVGVDPSGTGQSFSTVAILNGVRGLDVGDLFDDGAIDATAALS